jgi:spore maturation protein CgeB
MRWLVAHPGPSFSVQDIFTGWVEALQDLGQDVKTFNLDDRLTFFGRTLIETDHPGKFKRAVSPEQAHDMAVDGLYSTLYQTWPDVLLVISGFFIPPKLLDRARRTRTRVVVIHTESPYETQRELTLAPYADINLVTDPTNLDQFPTGTRYLPHAYRPSIHHPGPVVAELRSDFAFVGTGYPSRVGFLEQMDLSGLDVLLAGNWQLLGEGHPLRKHVAHDLEDCLDNEKTADVYRSTSVAMNLYRREAERPELSAGWAIGPREVELAATGTFFLRDPRPESNDVFSMLPSFSSPDEASELLGYWLAHPAERERLAGLAREAVADRTFHRHATSLLRLLDA